jgi:hypothetical protein
MRYYRLKCNNYTNLLALLIVVTLASCASTKPTSQSQSVGYTEDLAMWRPKPVVSENAPTKTTVSQEPKVSRYIEPKLAVNTQLHGILDSIASINKSKRFVDGFTIQVYSGKREEALNVKRQIVTAMPQIESDVFFTEPIYRVKAGKYFTRLQAHEDYLQIKRLFPAAIIVPEKLPI